MIPARRTPNQRGPHKRSCASVQNASALRAIEWSMGSNPVRSAEAEAKGKDGREREGHACTAIEHQHKQVQLAKSR
jgi:hypothetical protein